jgi:hypothetical protein
MEGARLSRTEVGEPSASPAAYIEHIPVSYLRKKPEKKTLLQHQERIDLLVVDIGPGRKRSGPRLHMHGLNKNAHRLSRLGFLNWIN